MGPSAKDGKDFVLVNGGWVGGRAGASLCWPAPASRLASPRAAQEQPADRNSLPVTSQHLYRRRLDWGTAALSFCPEGAKPCPDWTAMAAFFAGITASLALACIRPRTSPGSWQGHAPVLLPAPSPPPLRGMSAWSLKDWNDSAAASARAGDYQPVINMDSHTLYRWRMLWATAKRYGVIMIVDSVTGVPTNDCELQL